MRKSGIEIDLTRLNSSLPSNTIIKSSQQLFFVNLCSRSGSCCLLEHGVFCSAISQGLAPPDSAMLRSWPIQKCMSKVKLVELSSTRQESKMADIFLKRCTFERNIMLKYGIWFKMLNFNIRNDGFSACYSKCLKNY